MIILRRGRHPSQKTARSTARGMTPIEKNIIVVDDNGNKLTSTYAKRAKGLVKHGRARWLDDDTICLACPPDRNGPEDIYMENADTKTIEGVQAVDQDLIPDAGFTAADILERIDRIIEQGERQKEVLDMIFRLPVNNGPDGGMDGANRAEAIGRVCEAREKTNQKTIELLSRMYEDIAPRREEGPDRRSALVESIRKMDFSGTHPDAVKEVLAFIERHG